MTPRLAAHLRVWCRPWAVACLVDYVLGLPGPHCPRLAVRFSRGPSSAQRHESFSGFSSVQWLRQIVPWLCWSPCDLESWDCLSRYYVLRLLAPGLGCWACQWLSDEISDETHETHSRRTGRSELRCPLGLAVPGMQLLAKRLLFSANLHCAAPRWSASLLSLVQGLLPACQPQTTQRARLASSQMAVLFAARAR